MIIKFSSQLNLALLDKDENSERARQLELTGQDIRENKNYTKRGLQRFVENIP